MLTKEQVVQAFFELSVEDRMDVRRLLNEELDGLDGDDSAAREAWTAELERRIEEIETGTAKTVPWEVVLDDLKAKIGRSRAETDHVD